MSRLAHEYPDRPDLWEQPAGHDATVSGRAAPEPKRDLSDFTGRPEDAGELYSRGHTHTMTEEEPRNLADIAGAMLDVLEQAAAIEETAAYPALNRLAFQVQRLARQCVELVQIVDGTGELEEPRWIVTASGGGKEREYEAANESDAAWLMEALASADVPAGSYVACWPKR